MSNIATKESDNLRREQNIEIGLDDVSNAIMNTKSIIEVLMNPLFVHSL